MTLEIVMLSYSFPLITLQGPEHMKNFAADPVVQQKFKEVALDSTLGAKTTPVCIYSNAKCHTHCCMIMYT